MLPHLDVSSYLSQLFWLGITFSWVYFVIRKYLPNVTSSLNAREEDVRDCQLKTSELALKSEELKTVLANKEKELDALLHEVAMKGIKEIELYSANRRAEVEAFLIKENQALLAEVQHLEDSKGIFYSDEDFLAFCVKTVGSVALLYGVPSADVSNISVGRYLE